ncbi:MAG: hypothetical protein JSU89_16035 [Myxococcales bacterium]|nr:MAG: hypothetical protein JSU89_16035 [Myxococcales bacterium]
MGKTWGTREQLMCGEGTEVVELHMVGGERFAQCGSRSAVRGLAVRGQRFGGQRTLSAVCYTPPRG